MLQAFFWASMLLCGAWGEICMNQGWLGFLAKPSMYCTALSAMKSVEYGAVTQPASYCFVFGSTPGWSIRPSDRGSSTRMNRMLGRALPPGRAGPTTASSITVESAGGVAPGAPGSGIVEPTSGRVGSPAPVGTPAPPTIPRFPRGAAPNGVASPKENTAPSAPTS